MKLRGGAHEDSAFDGLTAEEVRRIRGAAAVSITPGMEGLAPRLRELRQQVDGMTKEARELNEKLAAPKRKRGRRA